MAIAVVLDFKDGTLEQYDNVIERMGLTPGGSGPPGALFHWVAKTDDGFRVVDVWETRELFDRFAAEQIGPHSQEAGIPNPPRVSFYEVHNHMDAGVRPPSG